LSNDKWRKRKILISLYGKGPDKDYLELLTSYYNIGHLVQFGGHVDNIKEIWKDNEFLLMCSLAEGTPLVLMEAMACGRGAVLTDVGGNSEWITDGYNGFIAPAPTPKLIDEAMERMWQNRHRSAEIGEAAFETFTKKFPGDAVEYFYNKILKNYEL
jgi:glycosyltransferase involved in cell wall biosynthesis